jgi:hypothetical protein
MTSNPGVCVVIGVGRDVLYRIAEAGWRVAILTADKQASKGSITHVTSVTV